MSDTGSRRRSGPSPEGTHRVVVVGGGFGGLPATRLLARADVDITLIDRRNHHLFQPLLYQVATGILSPGQIAPVLRHIIRKHDNEQVEMAEVTGFDLERRVVKTVTIPTEEREYSYDSLIVAAGAGQSYFGHDEFSLIAPGMKTIDDAFEIRRRVYGAFELAESSTDDAHRKFFLTVVIVGAGPTGVELAGQVRELATRSLTANFRSIDPATVRVVLVDGGEKPLASFGGRLSSSAADSTTRTKGWRKPALADASAASGSASSGCRSHAVCTGSAAARANIHKRTRSRSTSSRSAMRFMVPPGSERSLASQLNRCCVQS